MGVLSQGRREGKKSEKRASAVMTHLLLYILLYNFVEPSGLCLTWRKVSDISMLGEKGQSEPRGTGSLPQMACFRF